MQSLVAEDARHSVLRSAELREGNGAQALDGVGGGPAAGVLRDGVEDGLPVGDGPDGDGRAAVHVAGLEEVVGVAAVGDHLESDRDRAGRLAPDRDVARVAAEFGDVLVDPLQGEALVLQAEVADARLADLLAGEEAPAGELSSGQP